MKRFQVSKFQWFILLSLIVHALLFFAPNSMEDQKKPSKKLQYITLKHISRPLVRPSKKTVISSKQVVNSETRNHDNIKTPTRFLGKSTQSFSRQSIAKKTGSFKKSALGSTAKKRIPKKRIKLKDLGLSNFLLSQASAEIHPLPTLEKIGSKTGVKNSKGLAQNNDFINDIPLGDTTYLNTVEYKYFGFYERIRKRLEIFWGQSIQQKAQSIFSRGRRLPASRNLLTSLVITINKKGVIEGIHVKGSSGYTELDNAAIESFNQAGPFPNPPSGMIKNGKANIEWGFVINS